MKMSKVWRIRSNISAIYSILDGFYSEGRYCDVNIRVGNKSFRSHRILLAAVSEYFGAMFGGQFRERNIDSEPIVLRDVDAMAFEKILQLIYTGYSVIRSSDIFPLLQASDFLRLRANCSIQAECIEHIRDMVENDGDELIQNASECLTWAYAANQTSLINLLSGHILKHLDHFSRHYI